MPSFAPELLLPLLASFTDARAGQVAFSGGMDSTVLLHALAEIRGRLPFELRALHVDHGLHEDSSCWAGHCVRTCGHLGLPLETRRIRVAAGRGESLEAVARQERYAALAASLKPGDLLLTAQHLDDQAETLLLALMRGSGPRGLASMPRVATLEPGRLVRPLLDYSRAELLEFARSRNLDWLDDPANRDPGFDRSFLRHRVLPMLAERWPSCVAGIARSAAHCAEAQGILDHLADDRMAEVRGKRSGTLSIAGLLALAPPTLKLVLRHWFMTLGLKRPDARHLDRILQEVLTARADANPLVAWRGCEVRRYRDELFAMKPLPPAPAFGPIHWRDAKLMLPGGLGELELLSLAGERLSPSELFEIGLEVRFAVEGTDCRPAPNRRRQPLKKLYQEAAVPPWIRPYVPLIYAAGELIAVGDTCVCYRDGQARPTEICITWKSSLNFGTRRYKG